MTTEASSDQSSYEFVRIERGEGEMAAVATLRLDRPKVNALNRQLQREFRAAAEELSRDDSVRAVVLYGGERAFAAGVDIKEMNEMSYTDMEAASVELMACFNAVAAIPKPVIAAVTGYALGGGFELALCADLRFAADTAVVGQPEVLLGVIPGAGGTQRLSRLVGPAKAKDLIFTGRFVPAEEALALGMVDRVVPAEELLAETLAYAGQFAKAAPWALRAAKITIDRGLEVDLATGLELERHQFSALFATEDRAIGMQSFLDNGPGKAAFVGK